MSLSSTGKDWQLVLESLQQRNGSVEVTAIADVNEAVVPTYRCRLLRFDEQGLLVERPQGHGVGRFLVPGALVSVLATQQNHRWEIMTEVLSQQWHSLNAATEVASLLLEYPRDVYSAQRRQFFRVSVRGQDVPAVLMLPDMGEELDETAEVTAPTPAPPMVLMPDNGQEVVPEPEAEEEQDDAAPSAKVEPKAFRARVVNASGGGLGVLAPAAVADQLTAVACYLCRILLPTMNQPMDVPMRVVHLQPHANGTHYLGLCLDDERGDCKPFADELCRFSAWYQRRLLQRLRRRA